MASDGTIKINTELDSSKAESAMSKFSGTAKSALKGVTVAVGAVSTAMTAMAGYAIKVGSDFESGMSKVASISGATGDDLEALSDKAKEMGASTKFSATEAASAFEYMAMAGWKTEDMLSGIEGVMNLAAASGEDLATTSDIVTDALTAFGLQASDSAHFADVLSAASSNANTNVSMMGETFKYVAPVAGALGFSAEDTAVAIGLMANSGIKAGQAGTTLRSILSRLSKPTDEVQSAMDALGVSITNSDGSMKSLNEITLQLREGFSGLSESESASTAAALAGQEAMSGLLAIVGASDADFNKLKASIDGCDGATEKMAETMQDNLQGSVTIAKSAIEGFGIQIYEEIQDPLKNAVDTGTEYITRLSDSFASGGLNGAVKEAGEIFDDFADNVSASSDAAAGIIEPIRNISSEGANLAKAVLPVMLDGTEFLAENFNTLVPIVVGAEVAFKAFNAIGKTTSATTKSVAAATEILNKMERKNALQLVAANGGLTIRQTLLAVYNGQISATTALTGLWTKSQTALNTAINANPIGVAVAAAAAFVAVGVAVKSSVEKQTKAEREHSKALKENAEAAEENLQKAQERKQAYEEFAQAQNGQAAGDVAQLERLDELNQELGTIVDSTGRVKDGEEDRAAFITSQLSSALGIEIDLTDNQIQNYQELQQQIAATIQQKRIEAVMSAQEAKYQEAVNNQMQAAAEASASYTAMKQAENDVEAENAELESLISQKNQAVIDGNKALVSSLDAKIEKQKEDVKNAKDALSENTKAYKESSAVLERYASDIDAYTALAEAAASGNAEAIEEAINKITSGIKTASNATNEELQSQVIEVSNMENLIRQEVEKGTPGFTQAMLDQASRSTSAALEEFAKVAPQTAEELSKVPPEAVAALIAGDMKGQLSSEAKGAVDGMLNQFDGLDSETQEAFANAVYGALEGLDGFEQLEDPAEDGVEAFLESLRAALDEHSPSKKTEEIFELAMEGAANGVESGKEGLNTKAGEAVSSFLENFSDTNLGSKLTDMGSNIMSFFGIGVTSKSKDSEAAGKRNADAVNKAAGSADLTKTGEKLGSNYAAGVGSKSAESKAKGKMLSSNAELGASEKNGYTPGSDFGKGFVNGIGSWFKSAAEAAANLGLAAYNALKRALDERSPSKKSKKSGKFFDFGLGIGIEDNADVAIDAAGNLGDATLEELQSRLKDVDTSSMMERLNMAVDDRQAKVSGRIVAGVEAKERESYSRDMASQKAVEIDYKQLGKEMSKRPVVVVVNADKRKIATLLAKPIGEEQEASDKLARMIKGEWTQ